MAEIDVLHLLGSLGEGGRESLLLDVVDGSPADVSHAVCCFVGDDAARERFEDHGVPVTVVDASSKFDLPGLWRCFRAIRAAETDVLHCHGPRAQVPGRLLGRAAGVGAVVSTHHGVREMFPATALRLERLTRPLDTATVAVSDGVRHSFVGESGGSDRWVTIQNGIDVEGFAADVAAADGASLRARHGIDDDAVVYLNVGRYVAPKRQEDLVPAMEAVAAVDHDAHCFVVGGRGGGEAGLREAVAASGHGDAITVTGRVDDIQAYYAMADVFVSSSIQEGLPIVLLEAMAASLGVVATDIPGVRELIEDGDSGVLVPPRDPERLGEGMLELADDDARATYARRGHERVAGEFDVTATVDGYCDVYRRATGADGGMARAR